MGGPSFKTAKDHAEVWNRYVELIAEYGPMATDIKKSTYHKRISDETGYSEISVRTIINNHDRPNKTTRLLNNQRLANYRREHTA